jgi:hypothetical protein
VTFLSTWFERSTISHVGNAMTRQVFVVSWEQCPLPPVDISRVCHNLVWIQYSFFL